MLIHALVYFAFFYPLIMTIVWLVSGLWYFFHWERREQYVVNHPPLLPYSPGVTIIVPCHNESQSVLHTISCLLNLDYPAVEIIAVDDASSDDTGPILDQLADNCPQLRVIHFDRNQGKAKGLSLAAMSSRYQYLLCVDADVSLDPNAVRWMIRHFIKYPRVGAVTGNPRVATRSTLLGKIQVGEFSSIIGMIKRGQRILGRVLTVSGAVVMFRKSALQRIDYWNSDMVTEDIDVSWRLQLDFWDIRFETNALCWVLMPETLRGLWLQRLRWAQGGAEVLMRYWRPAFSWKRLRMWPIYLESLVSIFWAYTVATILLLGIIGALTDYSPFQGLPSPLPTGPGLLLSIFCLVQFSVSLFLDHKYEKHLGRYFYWMIWYPLVYWLIQISTTVVAFPKAAFRKKGKMAIWKSPDRGIHLLYGENKQ
jgi:biofilm PGA synthesis N-glycosyltransferase PgaC